MSFITERRYKWVVSDLSVDVLVILRVVLECRVDSVSHWPGRLSNNQTIYKRSVLTSEGRYSKKRVCFTGVDGLDGGGTQVSTSWWTRGGKVIQFLKRILNVYVSREIKIKIEFQGKGDVDSNL